MQTILSAADAELLEFDRDHYHLAPDILRGRVWDTFEISLARYYARRRDIVANPAADAWDPEHVRRIQAIQARQKAARSPTRLTSESGR